MGGFFGALTGIGQTGEQMAQGKEINRQRQMSNEELEQRRQEFQLRQQQLQEQLRQMDPKFQLQQDLQKAIQAGQIKSKQDAEMWLQRRQQLESIGLSGQKLQEAMTGMNLSRTESVPEQEMKDWLAKHPGMGPSDYAAAMKEKPPTSDSDKYIHYDQVAKGLIPATPQEVQAAKNWMKSHQAFTNETKTQPGVIRMEALGDVRMLPVTDTQTNQTVPMTINQIKANSSKFPGRYSSPSYDPEVQSAIAQGRDLAVKNAGSQVQSFGTFIRHAGDLYGVINELKNTSSPLINRPMNWLRTNSGDPEVKKVLAKLEPVRTEFAKFLQGNTALHDMDKENAEKIIAGNDSPAAMFAVLPSMVHTATARLGELDSAVQAASGKQLPYLVTPSAALAMRKMGIAPPQIEGGGGPQSKSTGEKTAIGPNGHEIVVRNGKWVDKKTGQPVQ